MLKIIQSLVSKWASWVGDREMEIAIRTAMTKKGLRGTSATFSRVRLVAIQRPGWLQVYSFDAQCTNQENTTEATTETFVPVFGLVRQDERYNKVDIECFESAAARHVLLQQWSEGLHQLRR